MIALTHLNGNTFYLNPDLIQSVEATPDTLVALHTGDRIVVRESVDEVRKRFILYKRTISGGAFEFSDEGGRSSGGAAPSR